MRLMFRRLLLYLLLIANITALGFYGVGRLMRDDSEWRDWIVEKVPAEIGLFRAFDWFEERDLPLGLSIGAAAGAVGLAIALSALFSPRRNRGRGGVASRSRRTAWLIALAAFSVLVGTFAWIALRPEEQIRFGSLVIDRGPRDRFLDFSLHVFLLVLSGHIILMLLVGIATSKRRG